LRTSSTSAGDSVANRGTERGHGGMSDNVGGSDNRTLPPAVAERSETAVDKKPDAAVAAVGGGKEPETIEDILIRSRRKEIVQRMGPEVERYLPSEDPHALLLPASRLEPEERRWQKVFVILPWAVFACMLATPLVLVMSNLPWLQKRAEADRDVATEWAAMAAVERVPDFEVVNFGQMPDILERPVPTLVLLVEPSTFASKVFLPALRDLAAALREAGVAVAVAALDLGAAPQPPDAFLWEYPLALTPHLQLILPRAHDGESGVIDYDGPWTAAAIAEAARRMAGPYAPAVPPDEICRLDAGVERLRDMLFELLFVEDGVPVKATKGQTPWWRRAFVATPSVAATEVQGVIDQTRLEAEQRLNLAGGLDVAMASCQEAIELIRGGARRTPLLSS